MSPLVIHGLILVHLAAHLTFVEFEINASVDESISLHEVTRSQSWDDIELCTFVQSVLTKNVGSPTLFNLLKLASSFKTIA